MGTRLATAALGVWLFVSAFLWTHAAPRMVNAWLSGLAIVVVSLVAVAVPRARLLNVPVGLWLAVGGLVLPAATPATASHDVGVGLLVALLAIAPTRREPRGRPAPRSP